MENMKNKCCLCKGKLKVDYRGVLYNCPFCCFTDEEIDWVRSLCCGRSG